MRTDDLIRALAADHAVRPAPVEQWFAAALLAGLSAAAALFAWRMGLRPDLAAHLSDPRVPFKFLVTLALAATALPLALRLARPGAKLGAWALALALPPALLAIAIAAELVVMPASSWSARMVGSNAMFCLVSVPMLALPVLAASFIALRHGAPTRPTLAGAVAGLLAGALGAALYAAHCPDDSPLFVAVWYSLAISLVVAVGAAAGRFLLRW